MDLPDLKELKRYLSYDPDTGEFRWIKTTHARGTPGNIAGCLSYWGYWRVAFMGKYYMAHRLAWYFMTGKPPINQIDHKNGIRTDNRFCNLREATAAENVRNSISKGARTGVKGVTKNGNRFYGRVHFNYKSYNAGSYGTLEEAEFAVRALREKLHKEFHKHG